MRFYLVHKVFLSRRMSYMVSCVIRIPRGLFYAMVLDHLIKFR